MKDERDEILYIQRDVLGGFTCPKCLSIAIGKSWADKAKYCPECGQRIKLIGDKDFKDLLKQVEKLEGDDRQHVTVIYSNGISDRISGIYKGRLDKLTGNENYIAGQMELSDFIGG